MRHFEKDPSQMDRAEAEAAYREAARNLGIEEIKRIEQDPSECSIDGTKIAVCKRLYRRIRYLSSKER